MSGDWDPDSGSRLSRRRALTLGGAAAVTALSARGIPGRTTDSEPVEQPGPVGRIHDDGVTGSGVRMGVLDTTGFAPDHPAFADAVIGRRSFDGASVVADGMSHGTAAAATVSRIAPDADLLLASFAQPAGFERALGWLRQTGADAVLAPVAAYGASIAAESAVAEAATAAAEAGVTVIAPTGNAARGHWQGTVSAGPSRRLDLRADDGEPVSGQLLVWGGATTPDPAPVSLSLVRVAPDERGRELVALSERAEQAGVERLAVEVEPGQYELVVSLPDDSSTGAGRTEQPVAVTTPTHRLSPADRRGSIAAPASAPGVLAVGRLTDGEVTAYSGRGPAADGRRAVDLAAEPRRWPTAASSGTSGAAARVAGVAALVLAAAPASAEGEPEASLRVTAGRARDPTPVIGYGPIDPVAAVRHAGRER